MKLAALKVTVVSDNSDATATPYSAHPVVLESDLPSFEALVGSRGWHLDPSSCSLTGVNRKPLRRRVGTGIVAAWGEGTLAAAEWWAAVLKRPLVQIRQLEEMERLRPIDSVLLVAPHEFLTTPGLENVALWSTQVGLPLGLVPPDPALARRHSVLERLPRPKRIASFTQFWEIERLTLAKGASVFGFRGGERFLSQCVGGCEAIFLESHGNGSDIPIGDNIVCARMARASGNRCSLPCFFGGPCLRGVGPDRRPELYRDPLDLRADFVTLAVCWGIMPEGSLLDPRTSVASVLFGGGWVRAIMAPFRVYASDTPGFLGASVKYLVGVKAGRLALDLNRRVMRENQAAPCWIVVGDPEIGSTPRLLESTITLDARNPPVFRIKGHEAAVAARVVGLDGRGQTARLLGNCSRTCLLSTQMSPGDGVRSMSINGVQVPGKGDTKFSIVDRSDESQSVSTRRLLDNMIAVRSQQAMITRFLNARQGPKRTGPELLARQLEDSALSFAAIAVNDSDLVNERAFISSYSSALLESEGCDVEFCRMLLQYAGSSGDRLLPFWQATMSMRQAVLSRKHSCGRSLLRLMAAPSILRGAPRRILICPRCGLLVDAPQNFPIPSVRIDSTKVRLEFCSPRQVLGRVCAGARDSLAATVRGGMDKSVFTSAGPIQNFCGIEVPLKPTVTKLASVLVVLVADGEWCILVKSATEREVGDAAS